MSTLLDVIKANSADKDVGIIDETIKLHPEMTLSDARTIPGTEYKTLVRTALGRTTGSFRASNTGTDPINHTYENRKVETFIIEPRVEVDVADAKAHTDGPEAYVAIQTEGALEGEMQGLCRCFYYGTDATFGNALAFPGLLQSYDTVNMTIDAGGTTDNTATSVWLVEFGPKSIRWVVGQNGQIKFNDVRIESLTDANNKKFDGYVQTMNGRIGMQVGTQQAAVRIKKITDDNGKTLTDKLLLDALAKFPSGHQPTVILMTRRAGKQLAESRTATNPSGTPAPMPTEIMGLNGTAIPIRITDSISDTETLAL